MDIPILDKREELDIINAIKNLSKQYTPEWDYNEEDPDFGSVFSKIFSTMMSDSVNIYNHIPYHYYIYFLNLLGSKLAPPISSEGMISVELTEGSNGVYIPRESYLYASADNSEGRVYFKTIEDMYAIYQKIKNIILTDSSYDIITKVYDQESKDKSFRIFDSTMSENLQKHIIYLHDDLVFLSKEKSDFLIKFIDDQSYLNNKNLLEIFSDLNNIRWEYYNDGTWKTISSVEQQNESIRLKFDSTVDIAEVNGIKSRFIRCVFKKIPIDNLYLTGITYKSKMDKLIPDFCVSGTEELSSSDFFPFGEQFSIFGDFYISSQEAFCKKGSEVNVEIEMKFLKIEMEKVFIPNTIKYKYKMSELDFQGPKAEDIVIERVDWEYWNGMGWAKLFKNHENEDFFRHDEGNSKKIKKVLSFICPDDIQPNLVGAHTGFFIRARISKIKNQFTLLGAYITPNIKNINISYDYKENVKVFKNVFIDSNLKKFELDLSYNEKNLLLKKSLHAYPTMYICLEKPIERGPVKMLIDIEEGIYDNNSALLWEYYSQDINGHFKWKDINVMDLTRNLCHTSVVTIMGNKDFAKTTLFGQEGYFIRIINCDNQYDTIKNVRSHPKIKSIQMNTVKVVQTNDKAEELFYIDQREENKICKISSPGICAVEVYVNEFGGLSANEQKSIIEDEMATVSYTDDGKIKEIWVKWKEISSIKTAEPEDRVFEVDYKRGEIIFGDGKSGKIPLSQKKQSIKIKYYISDGALGNVDEGAILGFTSSIAFIKKATNLTPLVGGVNMETVDHCAKRFSNQISGMGRIVSLDDLESFIKYNDRSINQIKCIPHMNKLSEPESGVISIAVLPKNYMQGYEKFSVLEKRIYNAIKEKSYVNIMQSSKIEIFEAFYVQICASIDAVIDGYESYQQVYQEIQSRLKKFLDPIEGNYDESGWKIGQIPRKELIYNYIKYISNIKWIKSINLFYNIITPEGRKEVNSEFLEKQHFVVPIYQDPEINLSID